MRVPFVDLKKDHALIKSDIENAMLNVARNASYILGDQVESFEKSFSSYTGFSHCIGVASGTDAILILLRAYNIGPGDEVITTPFSFIATALPITYVGAKIVFADIREDTFNIDPSEVEKKITKRTKAILPVALYGQAPDLHSLRAISKKYKIPLLLDAAQAHGATYMNKPLGSWVHAAAYSFYPAKNLGAYGDAGAILTNHSRLAKKIHIMRNVGRDGWYKHTLKGYNSRLDTLQAAILEIKLKHTNSWNSLRKKIASTYLRQINNPSITLPKVDEHADHIYHLFVIRHKKRSKLQQFLTDHKIDTGVHYPIPIHLQPAYTELGFKKGSFPNAEKAAKQVLSLPLYPTMPENQVNFVSTIVNSFSSGDE